jgi:ABC-type transport system substrate-binding protein
MLEQEVGMMAGSRVLAAASSLSLALFLTGAAFAQKSGGILKISHFDSPASMSLLEESTAAALRPMMGVFNNLVVYDQHVAQNSMRSIVPELATSWSSNEEGTELTFPLRRGVKWHDGKPFTAQDVKCTWDLLSGKASEKLRINPRKSWYSNVEEVTTNGDYEVTFRLKRPQPSLLALLASGWAPISLPRVAARHAQPPDRHRPVQVCRIQAERGHPGDQKSGVLERGPALSRRYRMDNHKRCFDAKPRIYRRQGGYVLTLWRNDPDPERHKEPIATSNL